MNIRVLASSVAITSVTAFHFGFQQRTNLFRFLKYAGSCNSSSALSTKTQQTHKHALIRDVNVAHKGESLLHVSSLDFMDFDETIGVKYSMVELPDSLMETTIFVGNLNQFVTDDVLSDLFQEASILKSLPSVVARNPNTSSRHYGFVVFPNVEEKEVAIARFHGTMLQGQELRVESIKTMGPRVRVPEQLVLYTVGDVKKTRDGQLNTMRRVSKDDVERLSRGQPAKKRGYGSRRVCHRLNESERGAFERSERVGFVTLEGTGYRRGRKGSPLGNIHRQWCDARGKPQIILCKASGGRPRDNVIVDLSPLRLAGMSSDETLHERTSKWKKDILSAAGKSGMILKVDYVEDNTETYFDVDNEDDDDLSIIGVEVDSEAWAIEPIWKLPVVSVGVFEGERSEAKAMVKELAILWETMDVSASVTSSSRGPKNRRDAGAKRGGRTKTRTLKSHRRQRDLY